jgi:hypothetical protein
MTRREAVDALAAAYDAREAARHRALEEVDRQFAAVIARRKAEHAAARQSEKDIQP